MNRREFMKLAGLSGLAVMAPMSGLQAAEFDTYTGDFFIAFNARGGWDTTEFCDPKGQSSFTDTTFIPNAIQQSAEGISYAPHDFNQSFFEKYSRELLVINGIDTITNGHAPAERYVWTGNLQSRVHPTFAALFAAKQAEKFEGLLFPIGYLSYGGYSSTGDLIPVSKLQKVDSLNRLSSTHYEFGKSNCDNPDDVLCRPYRSEFDRSAVGEALTARREKQLQKQTLPALRNGMSAMYGAQLSAARLKEIRLYLPAELPVDDLSRQIAITLAACKAGICISANLSLFAFDSHAANDAQQKKLLKAYTEGVDYLLERAAELGIRDRIVLMMSSEFSRTPKYNKNEDPGKDHWPVGSAMFLGKGIDGGRVIGATGEDHKAKGFDPSDLSVKDYNPDYKEDGDVGTKTRIRPEHIHRALRKLTNIQSSDEAKLFNFVEDLDTDFFKK